MKCLLATVLTEVLITILSYMHEAFSVNSCICHRGTSLTEDPQRCSQKPQGVLPYLLIVLILEILTYSHMYLLLTL